MPAPAELEHTILNVNVPAVFNGPVVPLPGETAPVHEELPALLLAVQPVGAFVADVVIVADEPAAIEAGVIVIFATGGETGATPLVTDSDTVLGALLPPAFAHTNV